MIMDRSNRVREEAGGKASGVRPQRPSSPGPGQCVTPSPAGNPGAPDDQHPDENRWLSQGLYRETDQSFRDVEDMSHDFIVRRRVNRLAKYMRGDYVVNSRMEKYMNPGDIPEGESRKQQDSAVFSDMDDQHMILPSHKRGE